MAIIGEPRGLLSSIFSLPKYLKALSLPASRFSSRAQLSLLFFRARLMKKYSEIVKMLIKRALVKGDGEEASRKISTVYVLEEICHFWSSSFQVTRHMWRQRRDCSIQIRSFYSFSFFSGRNSYKIILLKISVLKAKIRCRLAGSVLS